MSNLRSTFSNPATINNILNTSPKQAKNVRTAIGMAGTGVAGHYLGDRIGEPLANAIGGFIAGWIAVKFLKK